MHVQQRNANLDDITAANDSIEEEESVFFNIML